MGEDYEDLIGTLPVPYSDPEGLTLRQRTFVEEYAVSPVLKHAALATGFTLPEASFLLSDPKIASAVARSKKARVDRMMITLENVTREYARIAFQDPRMYFDRSGRVIPIHELSDDAAAALAGFELTETEVNGAIKTRSYKYKFQPKLPALEGLGKALGMFTERIELTGKDGADLIPQLSDNERARRVAFILQQELRAQALRAKNSGRVIDIDTAAEQE